MKKLHLYYTLFVAAVLLSFNSSAQMNYTCPNPTSSPFTSILGTGETIGLGFGLQNNDDAQTAAIDLNALSAGFRFYLSGSTTAYRYMGLSVNGWCWFSATGGWAAHNYSSLSSPTFSTWVNNYTNIRDAATFTYKPLLACFWDDLTLTSSGNSKVAYKITGVSPNRILTVEWNKVQRYPDFSGNGAASFQVIIRENPLGGTNASLISYNYFNEGTFSSAITASIGILGTCPGDFYSLNNSGVSPIASQTVETTTISAFAANNQLYRFTGAISASAVNDDICNAIALTYDINSTCNTVVGTTKGATIQAAGITGPVTGGGAGGACLTAPSNRDVWYTVTKPATYTTMQISTDNVLAGGTCSSGGVQFQVYTFTGSCLSLPFGLTEITGGCSNNGGTLNPNNSSLSLTGLPAGATNYLIRVSGDADAQLDFQICIKNASNDNVCGAVDLGVAPGSPPGASCIPFASTTIKSTKTRGGASPNYLLNQTSPNFQTLSGTTAVVPDTGLTSTASVNDVWFKFRTSATNADYVIDTYSGSLTDAMMALYAGPLNCAGPKPISSGTFFRTGALNNFTSTFPSFRSFIDDKSPSDFMPRIIATNLAFNTTYYIRVWRKNVTTSYPVLANCNGVGTTITCTSTAGLGIGMVLAVTAGIGSLPNNPSTTVTSVVNATTFTISAAPTVALTAATVQASQPEGTFSICVYERPTCGVKATCTAVAPFTPTSFATNPNGNFNGTRCSTPLALPSDTNGICYVNAPKIPTIGTDFAPLCGDNYKGPNVNYAVTAGIPTTIASTIPPFLVTLSSGNTNNIKVGSLILVPTGVSGSFASNVRVTSIVNATQFTISAAPTVAIPAGATSQVTITSDTPLNSTTNGFGNAATSAAFIPNLSNPMFYRVKNDVVGNLSFNFSNILSPNNNGIRAALYTLTVGGVVPSTPNYSCAGGVWTLYAASQIVNSNGTFPPGPASCCPTAGKLYGNTPTTGANYNTAAVTGANNTDKFTMTYNALPIGIYYLMIDGASGDRAYFDLSLTGTSATNDGVLPIKLLNFTGRSTGGINILKWSTSSEINNAYFTLERSFNGINFEPIAQIEGAGNSTSLINYDYTDNNTRVGITYYRLKQTDFNQRSTTSEMIALYSKTGKVMELSGIRPNPANTNFFADVVTYEDATITFTLRDVSGKVVRQHNASVNQGESSVETSLEGLENGLYFVTLQNEKSGESFTKKIVKQ